MAVINLAIFAWPTNLQTDSSAKSLGRRHYFVTQFPVDESTLCDKSPNSTFLFVGQVVQQRKERERDGTGEGQGKDGEEREGRRLRA